MEEILASIRRIISEEDVPADAKGDDLPIPPAEPEPPAAVAVAVEPEPEPESEPALEEGEDEVLELTERVESLGDIDAYSPTTAPVLEEPVAVAYEEPAPEPPLAADMGEGLVGPEAASLAASAFTRLSSNIGLGNGDATLEQIVRELLRPLLKQWLDDNLPGIVQTAVDAEVERIARGRVR
jgi:cell pole-organizing protein PopZ